MLKEHEDKYDLELSFKRKHRQCINEAKGFILSKIGITIRMQKIPPLMSKKLHNTVKNSNKFNFLESQIQVVCQLKPGVWAIYLKNYWDNQLYFVIQYGFPLDYKQESPLHHGFKNHSTGRC